MLCSYLMSFRLHLALLLALGIATPLAAQDAARKIDKALTQSLRDDCRTEHVIIRTKPGYRAGLSRSLRAHGGRVAAEHPGIDALTAEVPCDELAALARDPEVLSISQDARVSAHGARAVADEHGKERHKVYGRPTPAATEKNDGKRANVLQNEMFDTLGVLGRRRPSRTPAAVLLGDIVAGDEISGGGEDHARYASGFEPIGVAIIDSGIEPSADFGHRITHFYDFTSGWPRKARPSDPFGHGTHIAGIVGSTFVGVAPEVRLVGLRVLDHTGQGRTSHVIRALEFATANRHRLGIQAINLSLGHPVYEPAATDPLVQAVENAVRAGLVVITTSGNLGVNPETGLPGYAGVLSPGNAPSALTVGALDTAGTRTRRDDRVAPYSSRGPSWYDAYPKPDLVAPGHNVLSIAASGSKLRKEHEQLGGDGSYMRLSGTSMAAGITTGVVALMLQTNRGLTPNAVKMVLEFTAIPVSDADGRPFDVLSQGAGAINGSGAIRVGLAIDAAQPVGRKWLTVGMPFQSTIAGETHAWSQMMIWGPHRVIGSGIVDENRAAWANSVAWGEGIGDGGDNIVWGTASDAGDNIVWGTNFIWSDAFEDNIVWGTSYEDDNIVWGTNLVWSNRLIGIFEGDNIVWGTAFDDDNTVWGSLTNDNTVWGTFYRDGDNIVWGTFRFGEGDNIVWGTLQFDEIDNIVWGTLRFSDGDNSAWDTLNFGEADNIVWGTLRFEASDNIVWGTYREYGESDNIVWGTGVRIADVTGTMATPVFHRR